MDDRPGARHAAADAEARAAAEAQLADAAEGRARRGDGAERREADAPKPRRRAAARRAAAARQAQEEGQAPAMSDELSVEATGETVGEAKWAALRELERLAPGLDKAAVRFQVVSRGRARPARRRLRAGARGRDRRRPEAPPPRRARRRRGASERPRSRASSSSGSPTGSASSARIDVDEDDEELVATLLGADLGVLIGRHGQTIDAVQYLANAIALPRARRRAQEVVVDAAGLSRAPRGDARGARACAAPSGVARPGEPVELEPMTAVERKVVHVRLKDDPGVETTSEGTEPNRFVVVRPARRRLTDRRLERWLARVLATPGLTALATRPRRAASLLDDALRGVELVRGFDGPIVDVGSGGGAPGIPLAAALPEREVTLLEAERRKCDFLERWAADFPNVASSGAAPRSRRRRYGVAVAKALAPPPVAAEWCLPLVARGRRGRPLGRPDAPTATRVARVAAQVAGEPPRRRPASSCCARRAHAARLSAPPRRRPEASARLSTP